MKVMYNYNLTKIRKFNNMIPTKEVVETNIPVKKDIPTEDFPHLFQISKDTGKFIFDEEQYYHLFEIDLLSYPYNKKGIDLQNLELVESIQNDIFQRCVEKISHLPFLSGMTKEFVDLYLTRVLLPNCVEEILSKFRK